MANWVINKVSPRISQAYEKLGLIRRPAMARTLAKLPPTARAKALETLAAQGVIKWDAFNESRTKVLLEPKNLSAPIILETVTPDILRDALNALYQRYGITPPNNPMDQKKVEKFLKDNSSLTFSEDILRNLYQFLDVFYNLPFTDENDLRQAFQLLADKNVVSQGNLKDKILKGKFQLQPHMIAGSATPGGYAAAVQEIASKDAAAAQVLANEQVAIFQGTKMPLVAKAAAKIAFGVAMTSPAVAFLMAVGVSASSVFTVASAGILSAKLYGYKQKPGTFLPLAKNRLPNFNPNTFFGKLIGFFSKNIFFVPVFTTVVLIAAIFTGLFVKRRFYPPVIDQSFYAQTRSINQAGRVYVSSCHPERCNTSLLYDFGNRENLAFQLAVNLQRAINRGDLHDRGVVSIGNGVYLQVSSWLGDLPSVIRPSRPSLLSPLVTDLQPGEASEISRRISAPTFGISPSYIDRARGIDRRQVAQSHIDIFGRSVPTPRYKEPSLEAHLTRARTLITLGRYNEAQRELHHIEGFQLAISTRRAPFATEAYGVEAEMLTMQSLLDNNPAFLQQAMAVLAASQSSLGSRERGYEIAIATAQMKACEYAALVYPWCLQSSQPGDSEAITCPSARSARVVGHAPISIPTLAELCSPEAVQSYHQRVLAPYFPLYDDNFLAMRGNLSRADYLLSLRDFASADRILDQADHMISIINNEPLPWTAIAPHSLGADRLMLLVGGESWGTGSFRFRANILWGLRNMTPMAISHFFNSNGRTFNPQIDPQMFLYFDARTSLTRAYAHQLRAGTSSFDEQLPELIAARREINNALTKFEEIKNRDEENFWARLDEERNYYLDALVRSGEIELDLFRTGHFQNIDFATLERQARVASEHLVNPPQALNPTLLRSWLVLAKARIFQRDNTGANSYLRQIIDATNRPNLSPIFVSMRNEALAWQTFIGERPEVGIPPMPPGTGTPQPPLVPFAIYPGL